MKSRCEFTVEEVRRTSSAVEAKIENRGKRKELTTFDVNTNEMRCECQIRNSTELNTEEKLEDKFERRQD